MTSRSAFTVIEGGKNAERAWLEALYRKYGGAVFARCRYLLKNTTAAEDALHDVFAKVLQTEAQFRAQASPMTWLISIATNHCLNVLRANRALWHGELKTLQEVRGEAHGGPQLFETRDAIRQALANADEELQIAAIHYYVDEMTLDEVAALMNRSVPTIRKRLREFAKRSGQLLRDDEGGTP